MFRGWEGALSAELLFPLVLDFSNHAGETRKKTSIVCIFGILYASFGTSSYLRLSTYCASYTKNQRLRFRRQSNSVFTRSLFLHVLYIRDQQSHQIYFWKLILEFWYFVVYTKTYMHHVPNRNIQEGKSDSVYARFIFTRALFLCDRKAVMKQNDNHVRNTFGILCSTSGTWMLHMR